MRVKAVFMGLLVLSGIICLAGVASAKPAGEGAFLTEYASDVPDIVTQVEGSRLIALRYAKHFRVEPSQVLTYFRNELSVKSLEAEASFEVYYLDESRNIVSQTMQFRAGTKVFANKAGVPVLQYGTGNPLVSSLPIGGLKLLAKDTAAGAGQGDGVVSQVLGQQPMELANGATTPGATVPGAAATAGEPTVAVAGETGTLIAANPVGPLPGPAAGGASAGGASMRSLGGILLPIGIAGAAMALGGGGGSSAPPLPPDDGGNGNNPPPVVPEPSSILALGGGLALLAGVAYRKRRS